MASEEEGGIAAGDGNEQSGWRDNRTGESVETVQSTSAVGFIARAYRTRQIASYIA